ncbi:MAG: ribosome biogenesis GTPase Der [Candidatus Omnitrophica bacterium]|nr:ribosome biogenesis GTPase Der [Candidatus Omnitrophota bacterium]
MQDKIAIVGRPNVGKSALFNRLIKQRKSIVEKEDGVTRDRIYADLHWRGYSAQLIDTGGLFASREHFSPLQKMEELIKKQIDIAVEEAFMTIFVTDVRMGITPLDKEVSLYLKRKEKEVILAVNKVDNERLKGDISDFYQLGFKEIFPVSAIQGLGTGEMLDYLIKKLPPFLSPLTKEEVIKVAIVGKPNAGKSSFVNSLLGDERVVVDENPGTTRDTVDILFERKGKKYLLLDTAGLKKKKAIKDSISLYSLFRTQKAIERAEIVLLLIDIQEGLSRQDIAILNFIAKKNKSCLIALNKKDIFKTNSFKEYELAIRQRIKYLHFIPIVFISALKGENIKSTIDLVAKIADNNDKRVATNLLNKLDISLGNIRIYYLTQIRAKPPKFLAFVSNTDSIKPNHLVHFKNQLRKKIDFSGVPIDIEFRCKNRTTTFQ